MEDKVKVIIAAHKIYKMPSDSMYLPVQVGAAGKDPIGFQKDDEGENISELNPYFCELTGLFWAWKNLDSDFIGLVHYRRHFSLYPHRKDLWDAVLKYDEIKADLDRIQVFVPAKRKYYIETLYSHYAHTHDNVQLDEARRIIEDKYPEYIEAFDTVCARTWGYMFNMMIMKRELLDGYCTWLFDILYELRARLGEEGLSEFDRRYYGRIGEILFNVWLRQQTEHGIISPEAVKEIPVLFMENVNWVKKGTAFLKAKFTGKKYEGSF